MLESVNLSIYDIRSKHVTLVIVPSRNTIGGWIDFSRYLPSKRPKTKQIGANPLARGFIKGVIGASHWAAPPKYKYARQQAAKDKRDYHVS